MMNDLDDTSQTSLFASAKVQQLHPEIMGIDELAYDTIAFHVIRCDNGTLISQISRI